jgi:hypothetical protein
MDLCFGLDYLKIIGYIDANFAGDKMLTSGYVFLFDGMVVFWSSKIHYCVANSTIETEYVSCNTTVSNTV